MAGSELAMLLAVIDTAYGRKSWHGTNLRGSIRGVTVRQAVWRPKPGRHNIWELVVHAAYWKYTAVRRFTGASRGTFAREGSNWFPRSGEESQAGWKADVALLDRMHRELREIVEGLSARDLASRPRGSKVSNFALLSGVAAHDLYHAGQIQLLKRLAPQKGATGATLSSPHP